MKSLIQFISVKSKKSPEFEKLFSLYESKISNYTDIRFDEIKSYEVDRDQKKIKIEKESQSILDKIEPSSFVILCDEKGKSINSIYLAKIVGETLEVRKKITLIIGGAFGVSEDLKNKADLKVSLSPFVLNHLVAKTVLLEQLYRTFTILHKIPYHNE
jgi:23S rRNA (pseudouridine1915-N3)-methyltransferase